MCVTVIARQSSSTFLRHSVHVEFDVQYASDVDNDSGQAPADQPRMQ